MGVLFLNIRKKTMYSSGDYGKLIQYCGRDEAVDKTKLNQEQQEKQAQKILAYYAREEASDTIGFDEKGDKSLEECMKEFIQYHPNEIYQEIITLRQNDAEILEIKTKADWQNLASKYVLKTCRECGIEKENLVWTAFFHNNTANPHIHFYMFDKEHPNLKLMSKTKVRRCRSALANILVNQSTLFNEKELLQQKQILHAKTMMSESEMSDLITKSCISRMLDFRVTSFDKKVASMLISVSKELPAKGRLTMGYLKKTNPKAYDSLIEISDLILNKNESEQREFERIVEDIDHTYSVLYGGNSNRYSKNQRTRLQEKVGNILLREIKKSGILQEEMTEQNMTYYKGVYAINVSTKMMKLSKSLLRQSIASLKNFMREQRMEERALESKKREHENEKENEY